MFPKGFFFKVVCKSRLCRKVLKLYHKIGSKITNVAISKLFLAGEIFPYWKVYIQDQTARSVQSDLDLQCLQKNLEWRLETKAFMVLLPPYCITVILTNLNESKTVCI